MTKDELKEKAKVAADAKLEQELLRTKFKNADETRYKWDDWYKEFYAQYLYEEGLGPKPKPVQETNDGVIRFTDLDDIVSTNEIPTTTKSLAKFTKVVEPLEFIPETQDYYAGQELPEVPKLTSIHKLSKAGVNKRFNDKKHPLISDFGTKYEDLENASFADFTLTKVNGIDGSKHMDRYDIETNQDLVVVWTGGNYGWVSKTSILNAMKKSLQGLSKETLQRNKLWSKVEDSSIYDIDKFWTNFFEISSIINLRLDDFYGYEVHQKDMRLGDTKPIWVQTSEVKEWKNYERPKLFARNIETFEDFGKITEEDEYNLDMEEHNNISKESKTPATQVDLSPMLEVMTSLKDEITSLKREIRVQQNGISEKQNTWQVQFEKQAQNTEDLYSEIEKLKTALQDNVLVEQVQDLRDVVQELKETPQPAQQTTQTPQAEHKSGVLSSLLGDDTPQKSGLGDFLNKEDSMLKKIGLGEKEPAPKPYTNADRKRDKVEAHYNEDDADTEDLPEDIAWLRSMAKKRRDATDDFEKMKYDDIISDAFENDPILNSIDDDFVDKIVTGEADRETIDKVGGHLMAMMEAVGDPTYQEENLDSFDGSAEINTIHLSNFLQDEGDRFIVSKCFSPSISMDSLTRFRDSGYFIQPTQKTHFDYVKKRDYQAYKRRDDYKEQDEADNETAKELKKQNKSQTEINNAVKLFKQTKLKTLAEVLLVMAQPCIMSCCGSRYATFSSKDNIAILSPVIPYSQHFKNAASTRPSIEMKIEEVYPKAKRAHNKRDDLTYCKRYKFAKNTKDEAIVFSREKVNNLVHEAEKLGIIKCINNNVLHYKHSGQAKRYAINYYSYKALLKYFGVSFKQLEQIEQRPHFKFVKSLRRKARDMKRVERGEECEYETNYMREFAQEGCLSHSYKGIEYELHSYADIVELNEIIKKDMSPRQRIDATTKQILTAQERRANKQAKRLCNAFNEKATQETKLILSPVSKRPWTECGMDKSKRQNDRETNKFDVTSSIVNVTRAKNGMPYTTTSKEEFYQFCCDEMISVGGNRPISFAEAKPYVKKMMLSLGFSNVTKEFNSLMAKVANFANATVIPINGGHLPSNTDVVLANEGYLRWLCNCYRYDLDYLVKVIQSNACLTSDVCIYTYKKAKHAIMRARRFFQEHIGQPKFESTVFLQESMIMIATALDMQSQGDTPEIYFDCIASKIMTTEQIQEVYFKYYELYKSFAGMRKRDTKFVNKVLENLHIPSDKNTS